MPKILLMPNAQDTAYTVSCPIINMYFGTSTAKELTPPSSGSQVDADDEDEEEDDEEEDRRETIEELEREDDTNDTSMVDTVAATTPGESRENSENTLYPILFDQQNRDSRYLANVLGDALVKGLTNVAQKRPDDPVGYLATWLYQYASRSSRGRSRDGYRGPEVHRMATAEENPARERNSRSNDNKTPRSAAESRREELSKTPLGVLEEEPMEDADEDEVTLEFEDHTKMKDEEGQTVLHFAASRVHPDGSFYGLISHAEVLLAERDSSYRTARDMAEEVGQQENVAAIDRYVLDAFLQQRSAVIQMLVHEGYDHVLNISDSRGRDIATVLQLQHLNGSMALLRDIADFIKLRDELHTFVRHSYLEGVCGLVRTDHSLVTAKNSRARCALHVAVLFEHLDIIEALVKASSSAVHVPDNLGRTPLHYAMATRKVDQIARILIKGGAMRSTRDVKMRTPSYFFIYKQEIQKIYEEESRLA